MAQNPSEIRAIREIRGKKQPPGSAFRLRLCRAVKLLAPVVVERSSHRITKDLHLATRRANRLEAEAKALAREKAETGEALQAELEKLTTLGAETQEKLDAELRAAKKETAERWLQQEREKASNLKSSPSEFRPIAPNCSQSKRS